MQITDEMVEAVAECIWQAEWKRAGNGGLRRVPWCEIGDKDQERYRFVAREVAALTAALAHGEHVTWQALFDHAKDVRNREGLSAASIDFWDRVIDWLLNMRDTHPAPQPSGPVQALAKIDRYLDAFKRMENHPLYNESFPAGIVIQSMQELRDAVASALTAGEPAQVPSAWRLVPEEPTRAHLERLAELWGYTLEEAADSYAAFLDALPAAPTAGGGDD